MPDTPSRSRGRSDKFIKSTKSMIDIDKVLKENENSDFLLETQKAKTNAGLERIFPGVEEDEKTLSGMYEPALHNYPLNESVYRPIRPDTNALNEFPSEVLTFDQQRKMFPKSHDYYELGTGPADASTTWVGREQQQRQDSDADSDTPDFGTERNERDYAGFYNEDPAFHTVGSQEYWNHIDEFSRTSRINAEEQAYRHHSWEQDRLANPITAATAAVIASRANSRTNINTSGTGSRATRRSTRQNLVVRMHDRDAVADRISQSMPFAAGSTRGGRHSLRGALGAHRGEGQLPTHISPPDNPDYTVYSRDTPIAWRSNEQGSDVWHVPTVNYSSSSTNHQNIVRRALLNTHVSTVMEANRRLESEQGRHREQGIHLPAKLYRISKDIETFHRPDEDGDFTLYDAASSDVQNHIDTVLTPAVEAHKLTRGYINRKNREYLAENQFQIPLGEGDTD